MKKKTTIRQKIQKAVAKAVHERDVLFEKERAHYRGVLVRVSGILKEISKMTNRPDVLDLVHKGASIPDVKKDI